MTTDVLPVRARLRLSWTWTESATLWWASGDGNADDAPPDTLPSVSGQFVVADSAAGRPATRDIADVICRTETESWGEPSAWLHEMLGRYPGCAVVSAAWRPSKCMVAVRGESPVTFRLDGKSSAECCAVLCASFVNGWLAADLPLKALTPARLRMVATSHPVSLRSIRETATPISFGIWLINRPCHAPGHS